MIKPSFYDVIRKPLFTEKVSSLEGVGKYVFVVKRDASKSKVKLVFEKLFSVEVSKVNMINVPKKSKVFKGRKGFQCGYKKAVITIKDGKKLDLVKGV